LNLDTPYFCQKHVRVHSEGLGVVCGGYLWGFDTARGFPGRPAGPQDKKTKGNLCDGWPPPTPRSSRGYRVVSLLAIWRGATAQQRGQRHSRARGSRFRGGQSSVRIPAGGRPVPRNHSLPATCFACMARSEWRMHPASEWRCCPLPCRGGGHAFACSHSQSLALWFSVATADGS